jgi:hypothetical protein
MNGESLRPLDQVLVTPHEIRADTIEASRTHLTTRDCVLRSFPPHVRKICLCIRFRAHCVTTLYDFTCDHSIRTYLGVPKTQLCGTGSDTRHRRRGWLTNHTTWILYPVPLSQPSPRLTIPTPSTLACDNERLSGAIKITIVHDDVVLLPVRSDALVNIDSLVKIRSMSSLFGWGSRAYTTISVTIVIEAYTERHTQRNVCTQA